MCGACVSISSCYFLFHYHFEPRFGYFDHFDSIDTKIWASFYWNHNKARKQFPFFCAVFLYKIIGISHQNDRLSFPRRFRSSLCNLIRNCCWMQDNNGAWILNDDLWIFRWNSFKYSDEKDAGYKFYCWF